MSELEHYNKAPRRQHTGRRLAAAVSAAAVCAVAVAAPLSVQTSAHAEVVPLQRGEVLNQELMAKATAEAEFKLPSLEVSELQKPAEVATQSQNSSGSASSSSGGSVSAPPAGTPDPGSAQAIARSYVQNDSEYSCLVALWNRESGWNTYAMNPSSGAYGIPQSLPGSKMASAGADWQTNPDTQIRWGLGYIQGRYGSPCAAWAHSEAVGWY